MAQPNTLILITTYNRQEYLSELLPCLEGKGQVVVFDDGSEPRTKVPSWASHKWVPHHGREHYYALINRVLSWGSARTQGRVLMIPDDVMPAVPDPVAEAEDIWQEVLAADPYAICLNPLVDRRGVIGQWGSHHPVRVTPRAWHTGWADLCFYGDARVIRAASSKAYGPPQPNIFGSGVGGQFTRLVRKSGNMYQVDKTLWNHRQGPSRMCPEHRREVPL